MMLSDCVPRYSGMRAPADIGEQAGGLAIARLVLGLVDAEGSEGLAGPFDQLMRVGDRARAQQGQFLGRRDQRIGPLLGLVDSSE